MTNDEEALIKAVNDCETLEGTIRAMYTVITQTAIPPSRLIQVRAVQQALRNAFNAEGILVSNDVARAVELVITKIHALAHNPVAGGNQESPNYHESLMAVSSAMALTAIEVGAISKE